MHKIIFFIVGSFIAKSLIAQIAVMDSRKVLASIPQVLKVDTLLAQEKQRLSQEYSQLRYKTQVQLGIVDSLYRLNPKDSVAMKMLDESKFLNVKLNEFQMQANKKLEDLNNVLLTPYLEKVNVAAISVAIRLKYRQVLDVQSLPFLWIDSNTDITDKVIAELKKK